MAKTKRDIEKRVRKFIAPFRIEQGKGFKLKDVRPDDTEGIESEQKDEAKEWLEGGVRLLAEYQDMLYAQDQWAVLLVFQAMDAAGKDSTIKHVMSGVNPQGVEVNSFKAPSSEDLDHDYLWRSMRRLPERGRIGIFNRSYYEETLVVRVHRELLAKQKIPPQLVGKHIWDDRFEDINAFERYLTRNGVVIRKFFLHVSKKEQKKRFLERLTNGDKNWKFSINDVNERAHWDEYQDAYEEMIRNTATGHAPWFVVPADNKWFTRLVVVAAIVDALRDLELHYPKVDEARRAELREARARLTGGKPKEPSAARG